MKCKKNATLHLNICRIQRMGKKYHVKAVSLNIEPLIVMKEFLVPESEKQRLKELADYELLDTEAEKEFDDLVRLASKICDTSISLVSLIDEDRQWFKAKIGLDINQTDRNVAFCNHTILQDELLEIKDTLQDERFKNNPFVTGNPNIRFYAGVPLITVAGHKLGSLCVVDTTPKELDKEQQFALKTLARQVMNLIELRFKSRELEKLTQNLNKLISIVAHDVRNPLASLKAIIELKQSDLISEEEADSMLKMADAQLDTTTEMIENLIDWAKLQMKYREIRTGITDTHKVVDACCASFHQRATDKNLQFVNNIAKEKNIDIIPSALTFILKNLISNALKYTENGAIKISSKDTEQEFALVISDTGMGMDSETKDNLFKNAKNFSKPGTREESGSGLGLLLIKDLLDKINGSIRVESTPGRGTTITVSFN